MTYTMKINIPRQKEMQDNPDNDMSENLLVWLKGGFTGRPVSFFNKPPENIGNVIRDDPWFYRLI